MKRFLVIAASAGLLGFGGRAAAQDTNLVVLNDIQNEPFAIVAPLPNVSPMPSGFGTTAFALSYNRETGQLDEYWGQFNINCDTTSAEANLLFPETFWKMRGGQRERRMTTAEASRYFPQWIVPQLRASLCDGQIYTHAPAYNDINSFRTWYGGLAAQRWGG